MNLTAKELCEIIKVCENSHVVALEIKGNYIKVAFCSKPIEQSTPDSKPLEPEESIIANPIILQQKETDSVLSDSVDYVEELQISDPVLYEELIARGELVDGKQKDET